MRQATAQTKRHRGICRLCGADIYDPARARHEASFRCYARRGGLVQDGWVRPARCGGISSALYTAWPETHKRRWPDFEKRSDGLHFTGHRRVYLRSPRADVHIEVLFRAVGAYRTRHPSSYVNALLGLMTSPAEEVRRLALIWSPPVEMPPPWRSRPEPWDQWTLMVQLLRWDT